MNSSLRSFCALALLVLCSVLTLTPAAKAQVVGQNVNMVSGTQWPTGDPFLQRQNEPSMAVSTRNPMHILAGANDYRTVDLETLLSGGTETGDSWLGIFKSFDGGYTWQSTLLPGCPELVPQCTDNNGNGHSALQGFYGAASDPVVRAGTNGMFYYAGLAFVRPSSGALPGTLSSIFVARYNDLNNNENIDPVTYIDTHIVATGNMGNTGAQFLDKPALAVDIPRAGANTCSFTVNEPGVVDKNGNPVSVHQSFAAGNVYIAYTEFLQAQKNNATPTRLMFSHSTDCGITWSTPVQINKGTVTSQGASIAVNPVNGNVYVAWRQFASTGVSNAVMVAQSTSAGRTFSAPVQISNFQPFDQGTTPTSFRTNAYPSITTDMFGFVYVAFSARGLARNGDARVVAAGSLDGTHWTPAIMVDNPSQNATTNPSGRGHQIMPAITFANGRLTILYYDLRFDHYVNFYSPGNVSATYTSTLVPEGELAPPTSNPSEVFTPYIDDFGLTLRRHTIDLRVLELGIFPTIVVGPSVSVSHYDFGCCLPPDTSASETPTNIEQYKFNVPNLPLFSQGSEPFLGDYIEVVPSPLFVPSGSGWAYNFKPSVNPLFHATWTDNRDVVPPPNGDWVHYTPPIIAGTAGPQMSIFEPGQTLPACTPGQEGMRNQNIYTAQITGGLVAGSPGNAKPLGTTTFTNPVTGVTSVVPFQRAFAVEAQNITGQQIFVRLTIANQPTGGSASFLQFSLLTTLDITIPQYSSVSRSVFVTSTNALASVTINVAQISAIGGSVITNGLNASTVLNPDASNPNIQNPNVQNPNVQNPNVQNAEVTDPNIGNPNISNPNVQNPNIGNPNVQNPNIQNPNVQNPNIGNPNIGNVSSTSPNVQNGNIQNPNIQNPDTPNPNIGNPNIGNPNVQNNVIEDVIYPMTNNGNTTATYTVQVASAGSAGVPAGIVVQLILNKLYQTPIAENCQLGLETHWVTVANIINPKLYGPGAAGLGTPNIQNPTPNEASVTLAPGETVYATLRVQNPMLTAAQQQFNPLTAIAPVTVPQAVNTITVLSNPGNTTLTGPVVYPQLTITTPSLPATDRNDPNYSVQLTSQGGKPGPDTWFVVGGPANLPPGLTLSPSGVLSGTATTPGAYGFVIQVADSATPANIAVRNYKLNVSVAPLSVQTVPPAPDGVVNQQYGATPLVSTGGTTPYVYSAPNLPPGLSINPSTGQITGAPKVVNPAGTSVTITTTDAAFPAEAVSTVATIRVGAVIQIAPPLLPSGTIGVPYSAQLSATGGIGAYSFGVPAPVAGVLVSSSGLITIANPQTSSISFGVTVHDQANPFQIANANYTILFAAPSVNILFVTQPPNYVGGQLNPNSPVHIHVQDSQGGALPGVNVTMSLNGTPPCPTAVLGGTVTQQTNATGDIFYTDLTVDRGQVGYTMRATAQSVSGVSNPFTVKGFCPTGSMSTAREIGTEVLLPTGKVLLAGGDNNSSTALNTAELYDPVTGTVSSTGNLAAGRATQASVLLLNGKVLLIGGLDSAGNPLALAELYDPTAGTFTATGSMAQARARVSAVLLADGRVLVSGGVGVSGELSSCEIYDPATGTFSATGSLNVARGRHTMTLLPNGKVLVAGGRTFSGAPVTVFASAEIFDPNANGVGAFTVTANMSSPRDEARAVLLSNGNVLIAGGFVSYQTGLSSATADIFNPAANSFTLSASDMSVARAHPTATPLPDGTILVAGGVPDTGATTPSTTSADIFNPTTGTFAPTGAMSAQREYAAAVMLPNGYALVSGGDDGVTTASTQEIYYSTSSLGPMVITTTTPGQTGTTSYSNPTAFGGAASSLTNISFNGILPAGATNQDYNPLLLSGVSFLTPQPSTFVNVTTSTFYTPNYSADFIVDSANSNPSNQLVITLPAPTYAVGLNYGALGFHGASTGNITLSNGYELPLSSLPTVGQTQFAGFISGTPFTALTYTVNSDDWVLLNLQLGTANVTLTSAIQNSPYTQVLLEQGGVGGLTWSVTGGALPPGINLSTGSGILHGTPTAAGVYNFTVGVTDSSTPQKTAAAVNFTLTVVVPALTITTTTLPNAVTNNGFPGTPPNPPYSLQIQTSGGAGGATTFSVISGALPSSITLNPATGTLSSSSVSDPAGPYNFTVQAISAGPPSTTASQALTLTLVPLFAGTTPNTLPQATANVAYSQTLTSVGGITPFTYQLEPGLSNNALPPGLAISTQSAAVGLLSGTPTSAGTFIFNIQASDSSTPAQVYFETLTLNVAPQPPSNVAPGPVSVGSIGIIWEFSLSSGVTGYNVYRATISGGPYTKVGSVPSTSSSFTDTTVTSGTTYFYIVRAAAGTVESVNSNEVSILAP